VFGGRWGKRKGELVTEAVGPVDCGKVEQSIGTVGFLFHLSLQFFPQSGFFLLWKNLIPQAVFHMWMFCGRIS
jgi:hypothetical protein